jgi:hypothetical protein
MFRFLTRGLDSRSKAKWRKAPRHRADQGRVRPHLQQLECREVPTGGLVPGAAFSGGQLVAPATVTPVAARSSTPVVNVGVVAPTAALAPVTPIQGGNVDSTASPIVRATALSVGPGANTVRTTTNHIKIHSHTDGTTGRTFTAYYLDGEKFSQVHVDGNTRTNWEKDTDGIWSKTVTVTVDGRSTSTTTENSPPPTDRFPDTIPR